VEQAKHPAYRVKGQISQRVEIEEQAWVVEEVRVEVACLDDLLGDGDIARLIGMIQIG